jgi:oligopeptide transport system ATP-binding protein
MQMQQLDKFLSVQNLKVYFPVKKGFLKSKDNIKAVDGVSFSIRQGETLALVGESGCGKTTLCKALLGLRKVTDGKIIFKGDNIANLSSQKFLPYRKKLNFIFQDPNASLNPRMKVKDLVAEPFKLQKTGKSKKEIEAAVNNVLDDVQIRSEYRNRYPHEFSGGQQQRIGIARALVLHPELIICDEPVSALDVSVQAQIINLLNELQTEYNLAYIFVSHDLSVVQFISDYVAIMYLGQIVEMGPSAEIFSTAVHPYTRALLSAAPNPDPERKRSRIILEGDVPDPFHIPEGCRFHTRCPYAKDLCRKVEPEIELYENKEQKGKNNTNSEQQLGHHGENHTVRCHCKYEI